MYKIEGCMQKDRSVAPKIKKMAAILIFAPSEDDISERFLKNYIFFSRPPIKVRFFANILIFRGDLVLFFRNFLRFFLKKIFFFEGGSNFLGFFLPPSNKKNGEKTG